MDHYNRNGLFMAILLNIMGFVLMKIPSEVHIDIAHVVINKCPKCIKIWNYKKSQLNGRMLTLSHIQ